VLAGELRFHVIRQGITVDDIPGKLNVVVGKFADLGIVHTEDLSFFVCTYTKARDEVHDKENQAGAAKRVSGAGNGIRELVGKLDPVLVEPAALNNGESIEVGYIVARVLSVPEY